MSPPWMPLYIGSYLKKTSHLCAAEHGAYMLLIMHYWQEGKLPTEDRHLAQIAHMLPQEWRKYKSTIKEFFDDEWRHERIDKELAEAKEAYERRSKAGKKGGEATAMLGANVVKVNIRK